MMTPSTFTRLTEAGEEVTVTSLIQAAQDDGYTLTPEQAAQMIDYLESGTSLRDDDSGGAEYGEPGLASEFAMWHDLDGDWSMHGATQTAPSKPEVPSVTTPARWIYDFEEWKAACVAKHPDGTLVHAGGQCYEYHRADGGNGGGYSNAWGKPKGVVH